MRIYDISLPLWPGMACWPGDPAYEAQPVLSLERGDAASVSRLAFGTHTGTHIDAPSHVAVNGASVDAISLAALVGQAQVVYLGRTVITADDLNAQRISPATQRLLIRTGEAQSASASFDPNFGALAADAAEWLAERHLALVGIDSPSIDPFDASDLFAHRALLGNGIVVLEGLDLSAVAVGVFELICLPLKVVGLDGAPARAILIDRADT